MSSPEVLLRSDVRVLHYSPTPNDPNRYSVADTGDAGKTPEGDPIPFGFRTTISVPVREFTYMDDLFMISGQPVDSNLFLEGCLMDSTDSVVTGGQGDSVTRLLSLRGDSLLLETRQEGPNVQNSIHRFGYSSTLGPLYEEFRIRQAGKPDFLTGVYRMDGP